MARRLKQIRESIDKIDKKIIDLLNDRAKLAQNIKVEKEKLGDESIFKPEREAQILRKINSLNNGPLSEKHLYIVFREIMSACLSLETQLKVGCLGPEMSYSNLALIRYFGSSVKTSFESSIKEIFDAVETNNYHYGIVPIENSSQGSIKETLDNLISSKLSICGEVNLKVQHCLLSKSKTLKSIKVLYAHDQSFLQCNQWLEKNLPNVKRMSATSNSAAVKKINKIKYSAAIASEYSSLFYQIPLLKKNINDYKDNTTRFIVIGKNNIASSGNDKTSILASIPNKSGSLSKLLKPLADKKITMTKIESIPTKINNWEYMFVIDIKGHQKEEKVAKVLTQMSKNCVFFKTLGSYPTNE